MDELFTDTADYSEPLTETAPSSDIITDQPEQIVYDTSSNDVSDPEPSVNNVTPEPEADVPQEEPEISVTPVPTDIPEQTADYTEITQRLDTLIEISASLNDNVVKSNRNSSIHLYFIGAALFFLIGGLFVYALLSKVRD